MIKDLAEKYARMRQLRASLPSGGQRGLEVSEKAALKSLAADFPGALRELDVLATDELDERHRAIESWLAAPTGDPPRWMVWMDRYHTLMRQALLVRAAAATRATEPADWAQWCAERDIDFAFAGAALAPPGGRIMAAVLARLGVEFAASEADVWDALFPLRGAARSYRSRSSARGPNRL